MAAWSSAEAVSGPRANTRYKTSLGSCRNWTCRREEHAYGLCFVRPGMVVWAPQWGTLRQKPWEINAVSNVWISGLKLLCVQPGAAEFTSRDQCAKGQDGQHGACTSTLVWSTNGTAIHFPLTPSAEAAHVSPSQLYRTRLSCITPCHVYRPRTQPLQSLTRTHHTLPYDASVLIFASQVPSEALASWERKLQA